MNPRGENPQRLSRPPPYLARRPRHYFNSMLYPFLCFMGPDPLLHGLPIYRLAPVSLWLLTSERWRPGTAAPFRASPIPPAIVVLPLPPERKPMTAKPRWAAFIAPLGPTDRRHHGVGVTGARITPCGSQGLARSPTLPGPIYIYL